MVVDVIVGAVGQATVHLPEYFAPTPNWLSSAAGAGFGALLEAGALGALGALEVLGALGGVVFSGAAGAVVAATLGGAAGCGAAEQAVNKAPSSAMTATMRIIILVFILPRFRIAKELPTTGAIPTLIRRPFILGYPFRSVLRHIERRHHVDDTRRGCLVNANRWDSCPITRWPDGR